MVMVRTARASLLSGTIVILSERVNDENCELQKFVFLRIVQNFPCKKMVIAKLKSSKLIDSHYSNGQGHLEYNFEIPLLHWTKFSECGRILNKKLILDKAFSPTGVFSQPRFSGEIFRE